MGHLKSLNHPNSSPNSQWDFPHKIFLVTSARWFSVWGFCENQVEEALARSGWLQRINNNSGQLHEKRSIDSMFRQWQSHISSTWTTKNSLCWHWSFTLHVMSIVGQWFLKGVMLQVLVEVFNATYQKMQTLESLSASPIHIFEPTEIAPFWSFSCSIHPRKFGMTISYSLDYALKKADLRLFK